MFANELCLFHFCTRNGLVTFQYVLKSLTKQPAALIILLLVGYSQVFLHLHRADFSAPIKEKRSHHVQLPAAKTIEIGGNYFEVDNKKNSLKTHSGNTTGSDLFYGHVSAEFFFQRIATLSFSGEHFLHLPFRASLFRVLRL